MLKVISIIKKNFLIIFHSKLSSLILILGPILLIIIIGIGLGGTGLRDINANIYTEEKSEFSDAFIENLRARSFIVEESSSLQQCINDVRTADKNICIELKKSEVAIPKEFNITQEEIRKSGLGYSVILHADFSKQRIVYGIINSVQIAVNDFSSRIREGMSFKLKNSLQDYDDKLE